MRWRKGAQLALLIFFCVFSNKRILGQAEGSAYAEVVVLVDVSGTMQKYHDSIMQYAEVLDRFLAGSDINITWKAFADPGNIETIDINQLLGWEEFTEKWTDHKGAMEDAVHMLEESDAAFKCIVMLSDAQLDYDDNIEDVDCLEREAEKQFVELTNAFAQKAKQMVVLVCFEETHPQNEECLFKRCKDANVWDGLERGMLEGVLDSTLKGAGLERQEEPMSVPEGEGGYDRENWKKVSIYEVEASIQQGGAPVREEDGTCYVNDSSFTLVIRVETEDEDTESKNLNLLDVRYSIVPKEQEEAKASNGSYQSVNNGYDEDSGGFLQEIDLMRHMDGSFVSGNGSLDGDYVCHVRVMKGDRVECESSISIRVEGTYADSSTPLVDSMVDLGTETKKTGESVDLRADFEISEEDGRNYYVQINGQDFTRIDRDNIGRKDILYENGKLTFEEEESYRISIALEGDADFKKEKCYEVSESCWLIRFWKSLWDWIDSP